MPVKPATIHRKTGIALQYLELALQYSDRDMAEIQIFQARVVLLEILAALKPEGNHETDNQESNIMPVSTRGYCSGAD